jgi:hypothetical protein
MLDPFSLATDVVFASPDFGADATFTPAGGGAQAVRVLLTPHDPDILLGDQAVRRPGWRLDLNRSAVATRPSEGDVVTVTDGPWAGSYSIRSVTQEATCWRCHVDEAA